MVTSTGPQEIDENIEIITPETPEEQARRRSGSD